MKYIQYIKEFLEPNSYIKTKLFELRDLVQSVANGIAFLKWNLDSDIVSIKFSYQNLLIVYDFDIDNLFLIKTSGQYTDFSISVSSLDEAFHIIEKDIHLILGVSESVATKYDDYFLDFIDMKYDKKISGKNIEIKGRE